MKKIMQTMQPQKYDISSYETHATTITTDMSGSEMDFDRVPAIKSHEHYATRLSTDLEPNFQPVDLTIEVPIPPKFIKPLKNITSMEGTKVMFDGVVSGMSRSLSDCHV